MGQNQIISVPVLLYIPIPPNLLIVVEICILQKHLAGTTHATIPVTVIKEGQKSSAFYSAVAA